MIAPRLVAVSTPNFEATVPVVHDLSPWILSAIIDEPDTQVAFASTLEQFKLVLSADKRPELANLEVEELVNLMSSWIRESRLLIEGGAK